MNALKRLDIDHVSQSSLKLDAAIEAVFAGHAFAWLASNDGAPCVRVVAADLPAAFNARCTPYNEVCCFVADAQEDIERAMAVCDRSELVLSILGCLPIDAMVGLNSEFDVALVASTDGDAIDRLALLAWPAAVRPSA